VALFVVEGRRNADFPVSASNGPGPDDQRRLGIHVARFDYVP
jgi:hypothetical protein